MLSTFFGRATLLALCAAPLLVTASDTSGTITATAASALLCHDPSCTTPTPVTINFHPTGTAAVGVTDAGLSGLVWSSELGWITLDPAGPERVVVDPATGALSGRAWSQVSGWINFAPVGQGVAIDAQGQFTGWAWTGGPLGGWIKFDCAAAASCVRTDWRPLAARPAPPTPTAGNGPIIPAAPLDLCANIPGDQDTLPVGYLFDRDQCVPPTDDLCQNLPGLQSVVPAGFTGDSGGLCRLITDYCSNIAGVQVGLPAGITVAPDGSCVPLSVLGTPTRSAATTSAPNVQQPAPASDTASSADDLCPNLIGIQSVVPASYTRDERGACIPAATDLCPNLDGMQTSVPDGRVVDGRGLCVGAAAADFRTLPPQPEPFTLHLALVPPRLRVPRNLPVLAAIVRPFSSSPGTGSDAGGTTVDVVSAAVVLLAFAFVGIGGATALARLAIRVRRRTWGVAFDPATGLPCPGVRLMLVAADGRVADTVVTDPQGRYGFRAPPGTYVLTIADAAWSLSRGMAGTNLYDAGSITIPPSRRVRLDVPVVSR